MKDLENERYQEFLTKAEGIEIPEDLINWMHEVGFFCAPASKKYHGAYAGGLYDHSKAVADALCELTESNSLKWQRPGSPFIVGMLHDLCKVDDYVFTRTGVETNPEKEPGHAEKSLRFIKEYMDLTEEEEECIRYHMGAFTDKSEWRGDSDAIEKYPIVLWTHHADMIASHIKGI